MRTLVNSPGSAQGHCWAPQGLPQVGSHSHQARVKFTQSTGLLVLTQKAKP